MVSQQLLTELKLILKEDYGKDLSLKDVRDIADSMINYFDLLAKLNHRINKK